MGLVSMALDSGSFRLWSGTQACSVVCGPLSNSWLSHLWSLSYQSLVPYSGYFSSVRVFSFLFWHHLCIQGHGFYSTREVLQQLGRFPFLCERSVSKHYQSFGCSEGKQSGVSVRLLFHAQDLTVPGYFRIGDILTYLYLLRAPSIPYSLFSVVFYSLSFVGLVWLLFYSLDSLLHFADILGQGGFYLMGLCHLSFSLFALSGWDNTLPFLWGFVHVCSSQPQ